MVDDLDEAALAVEKVVELDRMAIRRRALERFSQERMVDEYEAVYRRLMEPGEGRLPPRRGLRLAEKPVQIVASS